MSSPKAAGLHPIPTIGRYMTAAPHTISRTQSLSAARRAMLEHSVRHLPVLDGGRIAGILSERDLLLVESIPGVNPTNVRVEEAMVQTVYAAAPDTPLALVVAEMMARKLGSTVVTDGERVVGVFTTVDALRALHEVLERR